GSMSAFTFMPAGTIRRRVTGSIARLASGSRPRLMLGGTVAVMIDRMSSLGSLGLRSRVRAPIQMVPTLEPAVSTGQGNWAGSCALMWRTPPTSAANGVIAGLAGGGGNIEITIRPDRSDDDT